LKPTIVLQNFEAESPGTIIDYLIERDKPYQIVHTYKNVVPPRIENAAAVVNMGCPISVKDYLDHAYLRTVFQYAQEAVRTDTPYLGLCFGGQILAAALRAQVRRSEHKELGPSDITLTKEGLADPLFAGFPARFPAFQWHSDTFDIPESADLLAHAPECKNQAFRYGRQAGIQFHMEVTMEEAARWCEIWKNELEETGQSAGHILRDYEKTALEVRRLNFLLLDNFFNL